MDNDLIHLQQALDLAAKGVGLVSPNPLVGCVIISASGEVVGEGTYLRDNVTHAEVIALEQAGTKAKGGTAYVSLEPHDHQGRTAPCTEALINAGISRVVCPIEDPNPLVSGKGFQRLRSAGIDVSVGLLADEASRLNEKFICWHKKNRPFVHLKLAMSLDGRISLTSSVSTVLSGETARTRVQEIRHEHDAILVGAATAAVDDPSLTDRSGLPRRRPLARIILDDQLRLPSDGTLSQTTDEAPTIVFTSSTDNDAIAGLSAHGVQVVSVDGGARNLPSVLSKLKDMEIQSLLVEGGSAVAGSFVDARLVDKVTFIYSPIIIGGTAAPVAIGGKGASALSDALQLTKVSTRFLDQDLEITGYPAE